MFKWSTKFRNLEVLRDLQVTFAGLPATIFGSSLEGGKFVAPGWGNDVDLMIEVDEKVFSSWAELAYEGRALGDEREYVFDYNSYPHEGTVVEILGKEIWIPPYSGIFPTRVARREAAQQVLGVDIEALGLNIDIFLFPHSFVREEIAIPVWDGTAPETEGRSFRTEVLAGGQLAGLGPSDVGREKCPPIRGITFSRSRR